MYFYLRLAVIEFVDIAGLVKGASKGEGLGNQFLANIREVDAIVHVVRCFEDSNVIHVDGSIDPIRDIETINLELIFSDLEILERRIAKVTKTYRHFHKSPVHHTLNRNKITSPSCTTYSLPSILTRPFSLAPA